MNAGEEEDKEEEKEEEEARDTKNYQKLARWEIKLYTSNF